MKRQRIQLILISLIIASTLSCKQMFTTSLAPNLARPSISISSKTSLNTLLDIASKDGSSDPAVALAVLKALGGKTPDEIRALSPLDKTKILNLAPTATITMDTIITLANSATAEGADANQLIDVFFQNFESNADLSAIEVILADTSTNLNSLPADSLIFASAVLAADLAAEIPAEDLRILLSSDPSGSATAPTTAQQTQIDLIIGVKDTIEGRTPDELSGIDIGGFNLLDLLGS